VKNLKLEIIRKIIGGILLVSLISLIFFQPIQQYLAIPKTITVFEGQDYSFQKAAPVSAALGSHHSNITLNQESHTVSMKASENGKSEMLLEFAGIPIKKVDVHVLKDFRVIPGGQSIGVKLNTVGVLVVGHHLINTISGKKSPGEIAGIKIGDIITEINGNKIEKMTDVAPFVQAAGQEGKPLDMVISRESGKITTKLTPLKDKGENIYKLGLYIRDSAAGIGTMTFVHPQSKKYGALGHVISDMDTKQPIVVEDGQIVRSTVTSIEKGSNGDPGEKLARFSSDREIVGNIQKNSPFGIFGEMAKELKNGVMDKPLPIALSHQVKEGPAKILTVVNDDRVEEFDI
jgi:stage IV sporulation protein B